MNGVQRRRLHMGAPHRRRKKDRESKELVQSCFHTLQRTNTENWKQLFSEKELRGHNPYFHIHVSVSDLYIPTMNLPILLGNM